MFLLQNHKIPIYYSIFPSLNKSNPVLQAGERRNVAEVEETTKTLQVGNEYPYDHRASLGLIR